MHHWEIGGPISIGWPDHDVPEREYTIVEVEKLGQVFRSRVSDGKKEGGFLVVFDCPDVVLEMLAEKATQRLGFKVIVSNLRCSIEGNVLRSFDYEWYPTPEFANRPSDLSRTIAESLEDMRRAG
ncbi:MAG: hypothetical protein VX505_07270 [Chloroflexota bacterium]|jgi:hypothetical protein|nr:hypothetical protein [Dehalococcoidia bacterium]MEE3013944.1 hypothetical protein [Chloroflexota bacterium]GIS93752.1 MAG: hypothetical protein CM1200mP22_09890 [Dehalococcoidia bacterium]|tara:strand:- start:4203 stop:4577 length:375 start_codon:yes stop_codon:yes gene_type:complete